MHVQRKLEIHLHRHLHLHLPRLSPRKVADDELTHHHVIATIILFALVDDDDQLPLVVVVRLVQLRFLLVQWCVRLHDPTELVIHHLDAVGDRNHVHHDHRDL